MASIRSLEVVWTRIVAVGYKVVGVNRVLLFNTLALLRKKQPELLS
jgi:hypothetical protein